MLHHLDPWCLGGGSLQFLHAAGLRNVPGLADSDSALHHSWSCDWAGRLFDWRWFQTLGRECEGETAALTRPLALALALSSSPLRPLLRDAANVF